MPYLLNNLEEGQPQGLPGLGDRESRPYDFASGFKLCAPETTQPLDLEAQIN